MQAKDEAKNEIAGVSSNSSADGRMREFLEQTLKGTASLHKSLGNFIAWSQAEGGYLLKATNNLDRHLQYASTEMHSSLKDLQQSQTAEAKLIQKTCAAQEETLKCVKSDQEQQTTDIKHIWNLLEPMQASMQTLASSPANAASAAKGIGAQSADLKSIQKLLEAMQARSAMPACKEGHQKQSGPEMEAQDPSEQSKSLSKIQVQQQQQQQQQVIESSGTVPGPLNPPGFERASGTSLMLKQLDSSAADLQQLIRRRFSGMKSDFEQLKQTTRAQKATTAVMSQRLEKVERLLQNADQAKHAEDHVQQRSTHNEAVLGCSAPHNMVALQISGTDQQAATKPLADVIKLRQAALQHLDIIPNIDAIINVTDALPGMPQDLSDGAGLEMQQVAANPTTDLPSQQEGDRQPALEARQQIHAEIQCKAIIQQHPTTQQSKDTPMVDVHDRLHNAQDLLGVHSSSDAQGGPGWLAELRDLPRATALIIRSLDAVLGHLEELKV